MKPMPGSDAPSIRIQLVDDQVIAREGLRLLLGSQPGLHVIGDAASSKEAVALAQVQQPDVILLDLELGDSHGLYCLAELLQVAPKAKILMLTRVYDFDVHYAVVSGGGMGIVRKMEAGDMLVKAIQKAAAGEVWLDGVLLARVLTDVWTKMQATATLSDKERGVLEMWRPKNEPQDNYETIKIERLTERELDVIALVGEGLRNQQIADRLSISAITVRHHVSSIFSKLEVGDRFELAVCAYRHGLAKLPI